MSGIKPHRTAQSTWVLLIAFSAIAVLFTTLSVTHASEARASWVCSTAQQCGDFKHKSPDSGYDDPIKVTCAWGDGSSNRWVAEGDKSPCPDTDGFYVGAGKEVTCTQNDWDGAVIKFDTTGWKKQNDLDNYICVHGLD